MCISRGDTSINKSLWDEGQINKGLRDYVCHHFPQNYQKLFDAVGEICSVSEALSTYKSVNLAYAKVIECCNNTTQKSIALLYSAWKIDDGEFVSILLSKGADANATDPEGRSCLHLSCCAGHPNNVEMLLRKRSGRNGQVNSDMDSRYIIVLFQLLHLAY